MSRRPTPVGAGVVSPPIEAAETPPVPVVETAAVVTPEQPVPEGMVKVRQLSIDAGPDGVAQPGDVRVVPADDPMIGAGYVRPIVG